MIRFASLGSGSRGNSLIVDTGDTKLLLDCGFSARATVERLGRLAVAAESVDALLLTHEHSDHVAGAFRFARRFGLPIYLSPGTLLSVPRDSAPPPECRLIDAHAPFFVGDVEVHPFPVPHDARRGDGIIPDPVAGIRQENCGKRREIAGNFGMRTPVSPRFRFTSWENHDWRNH